MNTAEKTLRFGLNGRWHEISAEHSTNQTLLQYLRYHADLTGTKEGCAEGDCGACTVVLVEFDSVAQQPKLRAVNSCLVLLPMLHGKHVITVEGLGAEDLHPVQEAMVTHLGSQCGYCTPGFVMSLFEAYHRSDLTARWQLDDQMCGNLCRCTGYRPIQQAAATIAGKAEAADTNALYQSFDAPKEAMSLEMVDSEGQRFFSPCSLDELLRLKSDHRDALLIAGGTDLSLRVTKLGHKLPHLISVEQVPELGGIRTDPSNLVWVGAATPLADLESKLGSQIPMLGRMLRYFGARQIKHRGTLGGNLCNASPIGDLPPVMLALDAEFLVASTQGTRAVPAKEFFVGYRETALQDDEVLVGVQFNPLSQRFREGAYKVSRRRELDISVVAAAFAVETDPNDTILTARLAYGGVAATPLRALNTEEFLVGQPWSEQSFIQAAEIARKEFNPISDHRGSDWFRRELVGNLLLGFYNESINGTQVGFAPNHTSTLGLEGASA